MYLLLAQFCALFCPCAAQPGPAHSKWCCTSAFCRPIQMLEQEAHAGQVELINFTFCLVGRLGNNEANVRSTADSSHQAQQEDLFEHLFLAATNGWQEAERTCFDLRLQLLQCTEESARSALQVSVGLICGRS